MAPEVLRNEPSDEKYAFSQSNLVLLLDHSHFLCYNHMNMNAGVMFIVLESYYGSYLRCDSHGGG